MRTCKKCGEIKPLDLFKPNKNCSLGYEHTCLVCFRLRQRNWEEENQERHKENQLRWQAQNLERYKQKKDEWIERNRETVNQRSREYAKANPDRKNSLTAKRRAALLQAIPSWANLEQIKEVYTQAKKTGMVVDHIIPLRGKLVCGLHVETNLQLLTSQDNCIKNNKFNPLTFSE
ncbi:MAG: hypothetical protein WAV48_04965 [Candidatus Magasanikiibacteriota bacterium]